MRSKWLKTGLVAITLAVAAPVATGQEEEVAGTVLSADDVGVGGDDDRGFLQALLEDNLSGAGRDVRITGFEGALSARAKIDRLTIADDDGIWLVMNDLVLDWNRRALLRGALAIDELSVEEIELPRLPQADSDTLPDVQASEPFSLPELPVSIDIGAMRIGAARIGEPVLGQAVVFGLNGSARMSGGEGRARLTLDRLEGPDGRFELVANFANATDVLDLTLNLEEGPGGLISETSGMPGAPSIGLSVEGSGPLDDFAAEISLATDGAPRLAGEVVLQGVKETGGRAFTADVSGDIRPMLTPEYRAFFGSDLALELSGATRGQEGGLDIDALTLTAEALSVEGSLALGDASWPERFALDIDVGFDDGAPVLVSLPGDETRLNHAELSLTFDSAEGEAWDLAMMLDGLDRADLDVQRITGHGTGTLVSGAGALPGRVSGSVAFEAEEMAFAEPALATAIGDGLGGVLDFIWAEGQPLKLSSIDLNGEDYSATGELSLDGLDGQLDLLAEGRLELTAADLRRFSDLSGQSLAGAAILDIDGRFQPVSGGFEAAVTGAGRDLAIGVPQLDALIAGASDLSFNVRRNTEGFTLSDLAVVAQGAQVSGDASLATDRSKATLDLTLPDVSPLMEGLSGPVDVDAVLTQNGETWRIETDLSGLGGLRGQSDVTVTLVDSAPGPVVAAFTGELGRLAAFSTLAGRPLSGRATLTAQATADLRDGSARIQFDGLGQGVTAGLDTVDQLLGGQTRFDGRVTRQADGTFRFDSVDLASGQFSAALSGRYGGPDGSRIALDTRLNDLGLFVSELSGPALADGVLTQTTPDGDWSISANLAGPDGTSGRVSGQISPDGGDLDLTATGDVSLAVANRFIEPNIIGGRADYALQLNGPPEIGSLSGRVTSANASLAVPQTSVSLQDIVIRADIADGRADLDLQANVSAGGRLQLSGPVALEAPFNADFTTVLNKMDVVRPGLLDTQFNGQLRVTGPLAGAATIGGTVNVDVAEIRIPESTAGTGDALPGLIHLNEPRDVLASRERAGLVETGDPDRSAGPNYGLAITVNAPSKVFVRGRGLDAELGGSITVSGSTQNIVTDGQFSLIRGRIDILGERLALDRATISLLGDLDPFIDLAATTTSSDADVTIAVTGSASDPEVAFSSSPELPEDEILARLLFDRDISEISAFQALRIAAAIRTLTGRGNGLFGNLRESIGVDDLDVTQDEEGVTGLTVGSYINENIYTDVTVDSEGQSEINLNLSLSPSVTARGSLDSDGNTGLGVFFERDY